MSGTIGADSPRMNDLEGIIVTVGKVLNLSEHTKTMERHELMALAVNIGERLVQEGYSAGNRGYADIFDKEWQSRLYEWIFHELPPEEEPELVLNSLVVLEEEEADELDWLKDQVGDYTSLYEDDELELYSNAEDDDEELEFEDRAPSDDELLDAPAAPKIKYPERAERKKLDPERARENAPAWAKVTP